MLFKLNIPMLRSCTNGCILSTIFLLCFGATSCCKFHYIPRNFPRHISFIEDFKTRMEGTRLLEAEEKEVKRINNIIGSAVFRGKWNQLCSKVNAMEPSDKKGLTNIMYAVMSCSGPEKLNISENNKEYSSIPEIRQHIGFLNIISNKLVPMEDFYKIVAANLFLNLNQEIDALNAKVAERLVSDKYVLDRYKLPNRCLGRTMGSSPGTISKSNFHNNLIPKLSVLFKYFSSSPCEHDKVIYKNIFNSFEVLYLLFKLAGSRGLPEDPNCRIRAVFILGEKLKLVQLAILEYLECEYFGNTDSGLTYSKRPVRKFIKKAKFLSKKNQTREIVISSSEGLDGEDCLEGTVDSRYISSSIDNPYEEGIKKVCIDCSNDQRASKCALDTASAPSADHDTFKKDICQSNASNTCMDKQVFSRSFYNLQNGLSSNPRITNLPTNINFNCKVGNCIGQDLRAIEGMQKTLQGSFEKLKDDSVTNIPGEKEQLTSENVNYSSSSYPFKDVDCSKDVDLFFGSISNLSEASESLI